MDFLIWIGIIACISQSAIFSGLNLAFFTISKLEQVIEAERGNRDAKLVLALLKMQTFCWLRSSGAMSPLMSSSGE